MKLPYWTRNPVIRSPTRLPFVDLSTNLFTHICFNRISSMKNFHLLYQLSSTTQNFHPLYHICLHLQQSSTCPKRPGRTHHCCYLRNPSQYKRFQRFYAYIQKLNNKTNTHGPMGPVLSSSIPVFQQHTVIHTI